MSRHHSSRHTPWLPPSAAQDAAEPIGRPQGGARSAAEEEAGGDLDSLLQQYEAEAAAQLQQAERQEASAAAKQPKGMKQLREEGLDTRIPRDNKGFQLLAKLGYVEGRGIGAAGREGAAEPIRMQVRDTRAGLGVLEGRKRKQQQMLHLREQQEEQRASQEQRLRTSYLHSRRQGFAERQAAGQLAKAQEACETLDQRRGIARHQLWPAEEAVPQAEQGEGQETGDEVEGEDTWDARPVADRLRDVIGYLRDAHVYCIYCGAQYEDARDMQDNCPGPEEDDH